MDAVRWRAATFAGHQLRYAVAGSGPVLSRAAAGGGGSSRMHFSWFRSCAGNRSGVPALLTQATVRPRWLAGSAPVRR
ncbi:hypothetical protein EV646_11362 [Kribbella antiqua]|uniref:Uncharacterized protein n=1 Tax=Kribbella antiqua TaxID=2512217 RepID=A0A4V2S2Z5_9ACTN|nr:hypothetical protein EV646_11362 [Kribbella antiqua]